MRRRFGETHVSVKKINDTGSEQGLIERTERESMLIVWCAERGCAVSDGGAPVVFSNKRMR